MANPQKIVPEPATPQDLNALLPNPSSDGYVFFENAGQGAIERTLQFRQLNCWWMIEMSYLVYGTNSAFVLDQLAKVGLTGAAFGFASDTPPHILVAHNSEVIIVAFRGTRISEVADVLADIALVPAFTREGLIHSGFHNALQSAGVWEQAQHYLATIQGSQLIFFTGHSLGAALATIARQTYHDPAGRQDVLYTFGSPRVGDQLLFCSRYPPNAYRIVNERDIVPHVPTPPIYGHIGTLLKPDGSPMATALWEQMEDQFSNIAATLGVFNLEARKKRLAAYLANQSSKPIGDHAPRSYATKIWNAL